MASDAERIIGLYQRHANAWARDRGNTLFETAWLDHFLSLLPPRPTILDIGCGSAEPIARHLIESRCNLAGIDAAPAMIALCRGHFPAGDWRVADMRTLSLGRTFNGLLAWDSLFHLCHEDQRRMFAIFAKHAAPCAALMFTTGPDHGVSIGSFQGEPLYHASLSSAEYRALLETNDFALVAHKVDDPSCGNHTIWLAQRRQARARRPGDARSSRFKD